MRTMRATLSLAVLAAVTVAVTVVAASCGAGPKSPATVTVRTVPVVFGAVQVSVPASWAVSRACPKRQGTVYLGGVPDLPCAHQLLGNVVVLGPASSASFSYGSPGTVNHIAVEWLDPDHTSMQVPSLGVSIVATGPLAHKVLATMTRSARR